MVKLIEPKPSIRAEITPELDERLEAAVALFKLRKNRELGDRSKLVRYAVEKLLDDLEPEIQAAVRAAAPARKPKK